MSDGQVTENAAEGAKKKKKINKLPLAEITKKIGEYESANQTQAIYYMHLIQRRKELQS